MSNSTCRCVRCSRHQPHLPVDEAAIERALTRTGYPKPVQPRKLRVVTMPTETVGIQCDGSMTCECEACAIERGRLRVHRVRQPWDAAA